METIERILRWITTLFKKETLWQGEIMLKAFKPIEHVNNLEFIEIDNVQEYSYLEPLILQSGEFYKSDNYGNKLFLYLNERLESIDGTIIIKNVEIKPNEWYLAKKEMSFGNI